MRTTARWLLLGMTLVGCRHRRAAPATPEPAGQPEPAPARNLDPYRNVTPEKVKQQLEKIEQQHEERIDKLQDSAH